MSTNSEPKLAAPGAGLPAIEHFIARVLFRLRRMTGSREAFNAKFEQERAAIRVLVDSCDAARRGDLCTLTVSAEWRTAAEIGPCG